MRPARSLLFFLTPLLELDSTDIDGHHEHFQDRAAIWSARIGATLGGQAHTVRRHVIRGQLRGRKSARDIHAIVVAAERQVRAEEEILNEAVGLD